MNIIRRIQKIIVDIGGFSRAEANGFIILAGIVLAFAIAPTVYLNSYRPSNEIDSLAFKTWVSEVEASIKKKTQKPKPTVSRIIYDFNPNSDPASRLMGSGIPEKIARRIANYRKKGGIFRKKDDLKKIYGLSDSLYVAIEPHILITVVERPVSNGTDRQISEEFIPSIYFDLNQASVEELQKIKGVGPVLSERIAKYRNMLGGFYDYPQLNEVYGLKSEVIEEIQRHSTISPIHESLLINQQDSIKILARHPYIDYSMARSIINYRKVHGDFQAKEELKNIKILDDSLFHKIAPYLSL